MHKLHFITSKLSREEVFLFIQLVKMLPRQASYTILKVKIYENVWKCPFVHIENFLLLQYVTFVPYYYYSFCPVLKQCWNKNDKNRKWLQELCVHGFSFHIYMCVCVCVWVCVTVSVCIYLRRSSARAKWFL